VPTPPKIPDPEKWPHFDDSEDIDWLFYCPEGRIGVCRVCGLMAMNIGDRYYWYESVALSQPLPVGDWNLKYPPEKLEALWEIGLRSVVYDTRTQEIVAAFSREDEVDKHIASLVPGHIMAWLEKSGPAVQAKFSSHGRGKS
jgi:hypothetical protein